MRKLLGSTLAMGASSAAVLVLDVLRVKFTAVFLGPDGVGVLSVLSHFHAVAVTLAGLGLGTGIITYTARYHSQKDAAAVQQVLSHGFYPPFLVSVLAAAALALWSGRVSTLMFGTDAYAPLVLVYAASLPMGMYPTVVGAFLRGLKRINALAKMRAAKAFFGTLVVVPLIWKFGLSGAAAGVIVFTSIDWILHRRRLAAEAGFSAFSPPSPDPALLRRLFAYGATSLLVGFAFTGSHLLFKSVIVQLLGEEANGVYQPVWAFTMTYPTLVLTSIAAYSFPRLCELTASRDIVEELNMIIRLAVLFLTPAMALLLALRGPVVEILYAESFLPAADILPLQIVGDYFKVLFWGLSLYLLPTRRLGAFIGFSLAQDVLLFGLAAPAVGRFGLPGAALCFGVSYALPVTALLLYSRRVLGYRTGALNARLLASSLVLLAGGAAAVLFWPLSAWGPALGVGLFLWGVLNISRSEVKQVLSWTREKRAGLGRWKDTEE
ncbi:MAG: oligosaccharide flippase family protein [Deltaproteobacteria bacterium]|nr:oligosaccharide flippase family protein [Deltaproteobacteria bacterium]